MLSINWDYFVAKLCSRLLHDLIQLLIDEEVATPTTLNSISSSTRISLEEKIEFLLEAVFLDHLKLLVVFFVRSLDSVVVRAVASRPPIPLHLNFRNTSDFKID